MCVCEREREGEYFIKMNLNREKLARAVGAWSLALRGELPNVCACACACVCTITTMHTTTAARNKTQWETFAVVCRYGQS